MVLQPRESRAQKVNEFPLHARVGLIGTSFSSGRGSGRRMAGATSRDGTRAQRRLVLGRLEEQMDDSIDRRDFKWLGLLRRTLLGPLTLLLVVQPTAQTPLPAPAQAMDMTAAELRAMVNAY